MALGDYNAGERKENQVRISPSSIGQLSDNEALWYRINVLGENNFSGNTATRLGTVTHYYCEQYLNGNSEPTEGEIIDYLESNGETEQWRILDNSKAMFKVFKENWKHGKAESEVWYQYEPSDELILSGTADIVMGDCILDIKTTGKLKSSIGDYKYQLYSLAMICNMKRKHIETMSEDECKEEYNRLYSN